MSPEDPKTGRAVVPPRAHPRSDLEYSPSYITPLKPKRGWSGNRKKSSKFPVYLFTLFVLLSAGLLVFALVVRPKTPRLWMTEVKVKSLTYSSDPPQQPAGGPSFASLNATLVAVITVSNPNFGRFDQDNTTVRVVYGGALIMGEKKVGPGRVGSRGSQRLEVAISVGASIKASNESAGGGVSGNFTRDVRSGLVKLSSYGRLSGKVDLMGSGVERRKTGYMNCEMKLNLTSRLVQGWVCR